MKIGPKYKLARRLGAPIFEKTQSQKYGLSLARKEKSGRIPMRPKSEFGQQMIEKQKARFTYGISERQFKNYVNTSLHSKEPVQKLYAMLETRLDNVLYRAGLAKTRLQARQAASHGHLVVNGRRVTIPSIHLKAGDTVAIRPGSNSSPMWMETEERMKTLTAPAWLKTDSAKKEVSVSGVPTYVPGDNLFDLGAVIEFYSR